MPNLSRYLEEARLDELTRQLQQQGFTVARDVRVGSHHLDLTAQRGDEKVAYEVVASDSLAAESNRIAALRDLAFKAGYKELRLSVVSPPRTVEVDIEGLESILADYIINPIPSDLDILSTHTEVEGVSEVELDSVDITRAGINVVGSAIVDIVLHFGSAMDEEGDEGLHDSVPFDFNMSLTHDLTMSQMNHIEFDTSSIHEPDIGDFDYEKGDEGNG